MYLDNNNCILHGLYIGANLKGVDMEGSQMTGINLRVATLKNAKLKNCNLRGATLAGTDLEVRYKKCKINKKRFKFVFTTGFL